MVELTSTFRTEALRGYNAAEKAANGCRTVARPVAQEFPLPDDHSTMAFEQGSNCWDGENDAVVASLATGLAVFHTSRPSHHSPVATL